ncbi:MAG: alanine--glyoxylate aminotransferase family protein [Salinisphaera sp.]|nr:alanine--glyoxylate aminotransferase family protein [Salinisphaera sp.]
MNQTPFEPPRRLLLGPGPSPVHERVLQAMARPTIGHLDPAFIGLMDEIKDGLRTVFGTENELTLPISGPATAAQEAAVVNLVEPGDAVVVCVNGVFGGRLAEMARRAGGDVTTVDTEWGRQVDPAALRAELQRRGQVKLVAFVHAETSTGVLTDAATIARIARDAGALVLMDTVTSLGGVAVQVDAWGIDACYSGTQKCLSCPPGLGPLTISERGRDAMAARKTPVQSWFLDLSLVTAYWAGAQRSYHHTAPVNALYGLHEALLLVLEEGLETAWQRHRNAHRALVAGLDAMGLGLAVAPGDRAPQLNTVVVPDGVDEATIRLSLLHDHGIEVGAGLGPLAGRIWRVGLMGQGARPEHVYALLSALEATLAQAGAPIPTGRALPAAQAAVA